MQLIGVIFPPIIDLINKFVKDTSVRFLIAFLFCAVVGIFLNWVETGFAYATRPEAFQGVVGSILAVFGSSQITYQFYKDSQMQESIDPRVGVEGGDR